MNCEVWINWCVWLTGLRFIVTDCICWWLKRWLCSFFWGLYIWHHLWAWPSGIKYIILILLNFWWLPIKHTLLKLNHSLFILIFLTTKTSRNAIFYRIAHCFHYLYSYYKATIRFYSLFYEPEYRKILLRNLVCIDLVQCDCWTRRRFMIFADIQIIKNLLVKCKI